MNELIPMLPWLIAMAGLICCSSFFSASEAALFSLRPADRRAMSDGSRGERAASNLLADPDRLLSAVLFWNLVVNIAYFAISSMVSIRIGDSAQLLSAGFAAVSLLGIIFFSEMLPKSIAVLQPRNLARLLSLPLSLFVRLVDPIMPVLQGVNLISRRLMAPGLDREEYLDINDLERAIEISGANDSALIRQEQEVLQNIVRLSNIRVDEWMRPRTQFDNFTPPVSLSDLGGRVPAGGYLLITEDSTEEIEKAIRLDNLTQLPAENLERLAEPVIYLPWCATVADAFEKLSHRESEVAVVLNEFGETIGILTIEDILETVFTYSPSRSKRLLDKNPLHKIHRGKWVISGMMSLRYLRRELESEVAGLEGWPETNSVTVGGVIQEQMQRLAEKGDVCVFGPLQFKVIEIENRGNILVELTLVEDQEQES